MKEPPMTKKELEAKLDETQLLTDQSKVLIASAQKDVEYLEKHKDVQAYAPFIQLAGECLQILKEYQKENY